MISNIGFFLDPYAYFLLILFCETDLFSVTLTNLTPGILPPQFVSDGITDVSHGQVSSLDALQPFPFLHNTFNLGNRLCVNLALIGGLKSPEMETSRLQLQCEPMKDVCGFFSSS